jgi:hypothetical protein
MPRDVPTAKGRRSFLRVGVWGGALLGVSAIVGRHLSGYTLPAGIVSPRTLSNKELLVLAAAVARLVAPDGPDAPVPDALSIAGWLDGYLAGLDAPLRRDLRGCLQLLEHGSSLFRLRASRFTHMTPAEQDATLSDWATSTLAVRRQGFQALRALAFLGYYREDRTFALLGYPGPILKVPT